jgi:hypothetical protein
MLNLNFSTDYIQFDVNSLVEKYNKAIQRVQEQKFPAIQGNTQQLIKAYNFLNAYFECISAFKNLKNALTATLSISNQVDIENINRKYLVALSTLIKLEEALAPRNQKVMLSESTSEISELVKVEKKMGRPVGWRKSKQETT